MVVSVLLNAAFEEVKLSFSLNVKCEGDVALFIWPLTLDKLSNVRPETRIRVGDLRVFDCGLIRHIEQLDRDDAAKLTALDETYMALALKRVKWALVEPEI